MIEVKKENYYLLDRTSSKGNQMKWKVGNFWYKADYCGYEGLVEYVISKLLEKSSLKKQEYVSYELETIKYEDVYFYGCKSGNFLNDGEVLITIERLFEQNSGYNNMSQYIFKFDDISKRIEYIVSFVERYTGLKNFGEYLGKLLTIDALFLNEDRHLNNIAVIKKNDGSFRLCPIFDNGAGLLSDTRIDYPLTGDIYKLMDKAKPRTVSFHSFLEQLEAVESLFGQTITFSFTNKDIEDVLKDVDTALYSQEAINRVYKVIADRRNIYKYLFD